MKKLLTLTIAVLMILSLSACKDSSNNDKNDNSTNKNQGDVNNDNINNENNNNDDSNNNNPNTNTSTTEKIDASKITSGTEFSEGKAWVRYGDITSEEYKTIYCINKNGDILFKFNNVSLVSAHPFRNGLAAITFEVDNENLLCLCDTNGKITKPSDVGATEFLIDTMYSTHNTHELMKDGYIFAKKTVASFSGSSTTAAILNSELEIVCDYSESILELYEKYAGHEYYNGYFYTSGSEIMIFDVRAGKEISDVETFVNSFEPEYASDMWMYNSSACEYYDILKPTYTKTIDLSQYSETIANMYAFNKGTAPIIFESAGKAFFSVLKEDGSFFFEPVEISGHSGCAVRVYNGKYVLASAGNQSYCLETFDTNGKIAEAKITVSGLLPSIEFCDDVIYISSTDMDCYYSLELEPLF